MKLLLRTLIPVLSLALIGWGAWWAYPPAGPLAVGVLLWIDLTLWGARQE